MKIRKFNFRLVTVLLALVSIGPSACNSNKAHEPEDSKQVFISRIQQVADSGQLFDPKAIAKILNLNFKSVTVEQQPQPADCSEIWQSKSVKVTTVNIAGESWYKATASGMEKMSVPGFAINRPVTIVGPPEMSYKITHRVACSGRFGIQDNTEATLGFYALSVFSCITPGDVNKLLPAAKYNSATDGVDLFSYQGSINDATGTSLTFTYRMGAPCAVGVSISQEQKAGLRFLRAIRNPERIACLNKAYHDYCTNHPSFTWGDGQEQDKMMLYGDSACGTIDSAYQKEPVLNKHSAADLPPPQKYPNRSFPCDGY